MLRQLGGKARQHGYMRYHRYVPVYTSMMIPDTRYSYTRSIGYRASIGRQGFDHYWTLLPRDASVRRDLLQAVLIHPSLSIPRLFGAFWSTFDRAHSSFVPPTTLLLQSLSLPSLTQLQLIGPRPTSSIVVLWQALYQAGVAHVDTRLYPLGTLPWSDTL